MSKPKLVDIEHKATKQKAKVLPQTFKGGWEKAGWTLVETSSSGASQKNAPDNKKES